MRTSLTKSEFASALGMKPDAVFVTKMFNIVDKDKDGRISCSGRCPGSEGNKYITIPYSDFKVLMQEYKGDFIAIGLDCKGAKQNFLDTSTNVARMTSFHIEPSLEDKKNFLRLKYLWTWKLRNYFDPCNYNPEDQPKILLEGPLWRRESRLV
ncbi:unnamed protein product [Diabrotica balteata]|uniref:EF-hand domain-containing protein n=1 Tax=Diabrotica balteata TaxID=107213 RepID=A0A9N9T422_DIABA|nr:unnamed protein product [Diabrotica balteata]